MKQIVVPVVVLCTLAVISGCDKKPAASPSTSAAAADAHKGHDHGPNGDHKESDAGHAGPVIQLGTSKVGAFDVIATRDQGQIVAGKDAPIDVIVTQAAGSAAKVVAVRIWIGTEDAKGSVKAKAGIEDSKDPNRWHAHVEIPNPIPGASKLWVEVEDDKGARIASGFDLKN